jgi:2-oxoisovalerate dehydrogenase E1 component beta subunit
MRFSTATPMVAIMPEMTLIDAVTTALAWELEHDPRVVVLGEDVGVNGGVFRATAGLQARFGADRVQDTPLAEGMIAGVAIGMAAQGMIPVPEIQFMGFIYPTVDQLISHAGRLRNRTRGRMSCPMVLRAPFGGGIHAPEHHSESTEALFAHMPGIRVVIPSSPARAYGLLLAAIRDPDPVVFLEPKRIYRLNKQNVEDNGKALPLDVCYTLRQGSDITIVTWGAMTFETLKAADQLAKSNISCEVIDLATISPIDYETILESIAIVAEKGLYDLKAPIRRVTGYDVVMPLFRREMDYMPSVSKIADAVRETLED